MRTAFSGRRRWVVGAGGWSAQLSGNRSFFWGEWSTQLGGRHRWVVGAGGWSAQVGGRRRWVIGADGWSTQLGGQRSWVVNAAGWSTQLGGQRSWVIGADGWSVIIDLFSEVRARLQQVLAQIGASKRVSEGFLPDSASGCQSNRRVVLR
jgi:hypothetical protein